MAKVQWLKLAKKPSKDTEAAGDGKTSKAAAITAKAMAHKRKGKCR